MTTDLALKFEQLEVKSTKSPSEFNLLKVVGKGAYGKVFLARRKQDDTILALKVIKKPLDEESLDEIKIFEDIKSPFLCQMFDHFEANEKIYMILEFLSGGDLFTLMAREIIFNEDAAKFYMAEIILALEHLHENHVIYRDLKPENVLIDKNGHIKLTDFGLAKLNFPKGLKTDTKCGTVAYQAPEMIRGKPYGHEIDIWALGCLAHYMLAGDLPFVGDNPREVRNNILKQKIIVPDDTSKSCNQVLRKIFKRVPENRISLLELKGLEFFESIDWNSLQEMQAPFRPRLANDEDVSQFDSCFTDMTPEVSPMKKVRKENDPFEGFDYQGEQPGRQASKKLVFQDTTNTHNF